MSTKVALEHRTTYRFDRPISIGPHVVRLRPAPHTRTPVEAYSLRVSPADAFVHWQQDPFGNHLARLVFPTPADTLDLTVGLVADLAVINPFDFFVEPYAARHPFRYEAGLARDLQPYLTQPGDQPAPGLASWLAGLPASRAEGQPVVEFLAALNAAVRGAVAYSVRMEEGVLAPEQTLARAVGSCRDSAWLLVAALRHFGFAARFVSGYLVQLAPDVPGRGGPAADFTDLHAWAEAFVPGAGWIGLDATSALFAGEGHIPLAATPHPSSAAAITGVTDRSETRLEFSNSVRRISESARASRPYTAGQVDQLHRLGRHVDERLAAAGLELTTGSRPTFAWTDRATVGGASTEGSRERDRAGRFAGSLAERLAPGGLVQRRHLPVGPGQSASRWQVGLVWRGDGGRLWRDPARLADPGDPAQALPDADASARAQALAEYVARTLGLPPGQAQPSYEDPLAALVAEVAQPVGPRPGHDVTAPGVGLVTELDAAETRPVAWVLPLAPSWFGDAWASAAWRTRRGRLVLTPGDLPAGLRLPLGSLSWSDPDHPGEESYLHADAPLAEPGAGLRAVVADPAAVPARTALVVQPRDGFVHVHLPELEQLERWAELVGLVEDSAAALGTAVALEGSGPPPDPRVTVLDVTPVDGVVEVAVPPVAGWDELSALTGTVHAVAREHGLGTEVHGLDGRPGSTGGAPLVLGGPEPARSPLLQRPDLLVSLLTYTQHHPSLSFLFAGGRVGAAGPAARVDEARPALLAELELALDTVAALPADLQRPAAVHRALAPLLTDVTGATERAELGLDRCYDPGTTRGRLGLVELRAFATPPHPDLARVQALLVRALLARFAEQPCSGPLVRWGAALHDRFLLPHFLLADAADVAADLQRHGLDLALGWLTPFAELAFPPVGVARLGAADGSRVELELRQAAEPVDVPGERGSRDGQPGSERLQVEVRGFVPERQLLTCNGRPVPLTATGTPGRHVAGVRHQARRGPVLHPTLAVGAPLRFDLVDRAAEVSLGGATYHVAHPGGRTYARPPVNAQEAEARRSERFEALGHTPGRIDVDALDAELGWRAVHAVEQPLTLDLRRRPPGPGATA